MGHNLPPIFFSLFSVKHARVGSGTKRKALKQVDGKFRSKRPPNTLKTLAGSGFDSATATDGLTLDEEEARWRGRATIAARHRVVTVRERTRNNYIELIQPWTDEPREHHTSRRASDLNLGQDRQIASLQR
jgi:hypothetical protein